jgi:hypothetical protein
MGSTNPYRPGEIGGVFLDSFLAEKTVLREASTEMLSNDPVGNTIRGGHDFDAGFAAEFERAMACQCQIELPAACGGL